MKKLKISAIFLSVAMTFMSLVGCGSNAGSNSNTSDAGSSDSQKTFTVGMVTDDGGLGDKSFNDATHQGLLKVKEDFNVDLQVLEPKQESDFQPYMERMSKNADIIVAVGYKLKDAVDKVSKQNDSVKYVLIDDISEGKNVHNVTFKEEEGSFLAGVLAGLTTKTNKVGFIGGTDTPLIKKFEVGFIAGVKSVNPEAGKLLEDGVTSKYAGNFSDVSKGYEIAKSLYSDGVDVIYHAAGGVGIGMFRAAKETNNLAIGVDQDQAISIPEYSDIILTSVVKNLPVAIYSIVKDAINGQFEPGTVRLGLKENGVYLPESTKDKVSSEVINKVNEYRDKIINGEVSVPKTVEELKEFKVS